MQTLSTYFFSDYRLQVQTTWFKRLLYCFLLVECCYYFAYFDLFFGENSIVFVSPKTIVFFRSLAFLLYSSRSAGLSFCFISLVFVLSLLNLFSRRFHFISDLLLWFLVVNIHHRIYPALTGGNNLLNQLLFFNWFLSASFIKQPGWKNELRICLHNLGLSAIMVQVCIVYFLSALAKLGDPQWLSGTAIIAISQVQHFSLFSFLSYSKPLAPVFIFFNYFVLFYQLSFPLMIWVKKIKKPLLLIGIGMHLYIAFVMGLVSFGFIMILAYVLFWPSKPEEL